MADNNEANRNDALTAILGLAKKVDASGGEPDFKVAEVATPFLVLLGDGLANLQRIADSLEGLHNLEVGKGVASQTLTAEEWETIEALRNGTAVVQPAARRHM